MSDAGIVRNINYRKRNSMFFLSSLITNIKGCIPPLPLVIKVCAVLNFIYTGRFFFGGGGGFVFFNEKGSKGKKVLLQDM